MALFEGYDRRIKQITSTLEQYGIASLEEARIDLQGKGIGYIPGGKRCSTHLF
jgi:hypothetical protein